MSFLLTCIVMCVAAYQASFQDELSGNIYSASKTIEKFQSRAQAYIRVDLDEMKSIYKVNQLY